MCAEVGCRGLGEDPEERGGLCLHEKTQGQRRLMGRGRLKSDMTALGGMGGAGGPASPHPNAAQPNKWSNKCSPRATDSWYFFIIWPLERFQR